MSRFVSLAGAQVAELADRSAEAGRLSRGRTLFRKGSVSDLSVSEGSIIASVRGSEGDEYETTIGTALAPPGVIRQLGQAQDPENHRSIEDLIDDGLEICPRDMDLAFGCDCADWDEPCKHVVAVILAFADRVDLDESELLRWRGIDLSVLERTTAEPQPEVQPKPAATPRHRLRRRSEPESGDESSENENPDVDHGAVGEEVDGDRTAKLSELEALLGNTVMRVPPTGDDNASDPDAAPIVASIDPAMAKFLGVGTTITPVDVSEIPAPAPLFADVQLGPLADLGPELATAVAAIIAKTQPT